MCALFTFLVDESGLFYSGVSPSVRLRKGAILSDPRIEKFARVLVDYSACVKPGDKVGIITTFAAEPLVKSLYSLVLERGAYPNVLFEVPDQDELLFRHAPD